MARPPHPLFRPSAQRLACAAVLFATWIGLVLGHVQGAGDLIVFCKDGLLGLGLYHASRPLP